MMIKLLYVHELNLMPVLNMIKDRKLDKNKLLKGIPVDVEQCGTCVQPENIIAISLRSEKFKDDKPVNIKKLIEIKSEIYMPGMEDGIDCSEPGTNYIISIEAAKEKGHQILPDNMFPYMFIHGEKKYVNTASKIYTNIIGELTIV